MTTSPTATKYTIYGGDIDRIVEGWLDQIVDAVTSEVSGLTSLVLAGGYARGEGSVAFLGDRVQPINDFDILLVSDKPLSIPEEKLHSLSLELCQQFTKTEFSFTDGSSALMNFYIDFRPITLNELRRLPPLLKYYELRNAGRVRWGDPNVLRIIPDYKISDFPKEEGLRFLLNRTCLLVEFFRRRFMRDGLTSEQRDSLLYMLVKCHLSIAEAVLLLDESFEPYYTRRAEIFPTVLANAFPDLLKMAPDLAEGVHWATSMKLDFAQRHGSVSDDELWRRWWQTLQHLAITITFCIERLYRIRVSPQSMEGFGQALRRIRTRFYSPYIRAVMRKYPGGRYLGAFTIPGSLLGQVYLNYLYFLRQKRLKGVSYPRVLTDTIDPGFKLYEAAIEMLFGLNHDGSFSEPRVSRALGRLSKLVPVDAENKDWDEAADTFSSAYRIYEFLMSW